MKYSLLSLLTYGRRRRRCVGKVREYFQRCLGRFSTILCLENLPHNLKRLGEGKKKGERGIKNMCGGREENIFKSVVEGFQQFYIFHSIKNKMRGRGRKKIRKEVKRIFSNFECFIVIPFPSTLKKDQI